MPPIRLRKLISEVGDDGIGLDCTRRLMESFITDDNSVPVAVRLGVKLRPVRLESLTFIHPYFDPHKTNEFGVRRS